MNEKEQKAFDATQADENKTRKELAAMQQTERAEALAEKEAEEREKQVIIADDVGVLNVAETS